ncbi:alkane 1-monooxygenase [Aquimarina agarilytica]|uniref:alkane 1-monooxygenase n=1 Tax=Aquimarina agarilytica TaxID=1087449 RepID=UPI000288D7E6|nr:alkane 1-monooxygenase [Aquimarina agarilytica]
MIFRSLKYFFVYLLPVTVYYSFNVSGIQTFMPLFVFFGGVPLLELFLKPNMVNLEKEVEAKEKNKLIYDLILYVALPVQIVFLIYFFNSIQHVPFGTVDFYGKVTAMGLMCGVLGINVGHELGHRRSRLKQFVGELLLLSSLDTHFLPYHNAGHHKNVATPEDAATAKKNQWVFSFWFTSHFRSYTQAWRHECLRLNRLNRSWFSIDNRMILYTIASLLLLGSIYLFFSLHVLLAFILASIFGIGLLETVNYIEHYGLLRKKMESGRYEKVKHSHSWNSDHVIGRTLLFNLSRHSDHHYNGSKKYQILKSLPESPKMPTGYPGMMLLALVPPIWFFVMNRRLNN